MTVEQPADSPAHTITWRDSGREPRCEPNPEFPNGIDVVIGNPIDPSCGVTLPYPARRCGYYIVECRACGLRIAITTAGRPDDPRSVRFPCDRPPVHSQ